MIFFLIFIIYIIIIFFFYFKDDEAEKEKTKQRQDELQRQEKIESKLYESVQLLMKLIFNVKAMEEQMLEMNYDAKKAPLGLFHLESLFFFFKKKKKKKKCINPKFRKAHKRTN